MKILHIADLHIGKRMNEFSLYDDQEYILGEILRIVSGQSVDVVAIAGDVYDKSMPSTESVSILDNFITQLCGMGIKIVMIAGNHDSAERLSFASRILGSSGVHISKSYMREQKPVELYDNFGKVNFYLLPYISPSTVRGKFDDKQVASFTDAVSEAVADFKVDYSERNVLVCHQFIAGASKYENDGIAVGGTENVDCSVLSEFDYVAIGHLHAPQIVGGSEFMRYSGSPLKYSFAESGVDKSVCIIELNQKGERKVSTVPLVPVRDLCKIKGDYETLMSRDYYDKIDTQKYMHITLTDEVDIIDAIAKLRTVYPFVMQMCYDNTRTQNYNSVGIDFLAPKVSPQENFEKLYQLQNNAPLDEQEKEIIAKLVEEIWGEN